MLNPQSQSQRGTQALQINVRSPPRSLHTITRYNSLLTAYSPPLQVTGATGLANVVKSNLGASVEPERWGANEMHDTTL